jgi:hypothetical protein
MPKHMLIIIDLPAVAMFLLIGAAAIGGDVPGPAPPAATRTPAAVKPPTAPAPAATQGKTDAAAANPLAYDYADAPKTGVADPKEEITAVIRREFGYPEWDSDTRGFVHTEEKNLWTRLRRDYNLHGFVQFGVGNHDFWETRTGMEIDLVPGGGIRLGLEAGVGNYSCLPWCDDWDW